MLNLSCQYASKNVQTVLERAKSLITTLQTTGNAVGRCTADIDVKNSNDPPSWNANMVFDLAIPERTVAGAPVKLSCDEYTTASPPYTICNEMKRLGLVCYEQCAAEATGSTTTEEIENEAFGEPDQIEGIFVFCLIWACGGALLHDSRLKLNDLVTSIYVEGSGKELFAHGLN